MSENATLFPPRPSDWNALVTRIEAQPTARAERTEQIVTAIVAAMFAAKIELDDYYLRKLRIDAAFNAAEDIIRRVDDMKESAE